VGGSATLAVVLTGPAFDCRYYVYCPGGGAGKCSHSFGGSRHASPVPLGFRLAPVPL